MILIGILMCLGMRKSYELQRRRADCTSMQSDQCLGYSLPIDRMIPLVSVSKISIP